MSEPKVVRYSVLDTGHEDPDCPCQHREAENGTWVHYSDYKGDIKTLAARIKELEGRLAEADRINSEFVGLNKRLREDRDTWRRVAERLESENKRLREEIQNELPYLEAESPASYRRIKAALEEKP